MVQDLGAHVRAVHDAHIPWRAVLHCSMADGGCGWDGSRGLLDGEHVSEGAAVPTEVAGTELVGAGVVHHQEIAFAVQAPDHLLTVALGVAGDGGDDGGWAEGLQPPADLHGGAVDDQDAGAVAVPHLGPAVGDLHGPHWVRVLPWVIVRDVEFGPVCCVGAQVGAVVPWQALRH